MRFPRELDLALSGTPDEKRWILKVAQSALAMFEETTGHHAVDWTQDAVVNTQYEGRWTAVETLWVLQCVHEVGRQKLEENLSFGVRLLCPFDRRQDLTKNGRRHGDDGGWRGDIEDIVGRRGRKVCNKLG